MTAGRAQVLGDANVTRVRDWIVALDGLASERHLESLQKRLRDCGSVTGSLQLDLARRESARTAEN